MGYILRVSGLVCGYGEEEVLKGISFSVAEGSFLGIIGPNGSGKTTLFRCITRVLKPYRGEIFYKGKSLNRIPRRELAREVAVLPQMLSIPFPCSVEEFVLMGRFPYLGRLERGKRADLEMVEKAMVLTDILPLRERRVSELCGGERQRVILAQALAQEPELLLLDEPTSHMDIGHQIEILDLLRKLNREKKITVIMVSHDLNLAGEYCERLILLKEGTIYQKGSPAEVLSYVHIEAVYETVVLVENNPLSGKPYIILVSGEERAIEKGKRWGG
ncbi:MAG: ABC transporter ATP-binding protein [Nitrospirae bacterium]|nr:ABC transporter ATP-binding protein [Nitrospirota bacterium]